MFRSADQQRDVVWRYLEFLWDRPKIAGGIYTGRRYDKSRTVFDLLDIVTSVSYTHLDVYKRQEQMQNFNLPLEPARIYTKGNPGAPLHNTILKLTHEQFYVHSQKLIQLFVYVYKLIKYHVNNHAK